MRHCKLVTSANRGAVPNYGTVQPRSPWLWQNKAHNINTTNCTPKYFSRWLVKHLHLQRNLGGQNNHLVHFAWISSHLVNHKSPLVQLLELLAVLEVTSTCTMVCSCSYFAGSDAYLASSLYTATETSKHHGKINSWRIKPLIVGTMLR